MPITDTGSIKTIQRKDHANVNNSSGNNSHLALPTRALGLKTFPGRTMFMTNGGSWKVPAW